MKQFTQNTKFRVIINGVHIYTTAKTIRKGIGDNIKINASVQRALESLENMRADKTPAVGLVGHWENNSVQIDVM